VLEVLPAVLRWYEDERTRLRLDVADAHTHVGEHDPDTMRCTPAQLLAHVVAADARAAVFPLQEPGGYRAPNAATIAAAAASDGRLVAFARLDPHDEPLAEAQRCLEAGARGIKLHPRAERFALDAAPLDEVWTLAHERQLPVLVHAGRGIPALGAQAVEICTRFPDLRLILAHAGICDLAWIGRQAQRLPNLCFDTSWWGPADLLALFATVPPGQILFASDAPYGRIPTGALQTLRAAQQAGLDEHQLRLVMGGQLTRLLAGEEPLDGGPAPGAMTTTVDVMLDRAATYLTAAFAQFVRGGSGQEMLSLARLACEVPADAPQADHCRIVLELIEAFEQLGAVPVEGSPFPSGLHLLVLALNVARTPGVAVPGALLAA
jgi:predicted TIM-barrel fold metal-dependent hydrolase